MDLFLEKTPIIFLLDDGVWGLFLRLVEEECFK